MGTMVNNELPAGGHFNIVRDIRYRLAQKAWDWVSFQFALKFGKPAKFHI